MVEIDRFRGYYSVVVLCNVEVVTKYDRTRSVLPSAPHDVEYGNNTTEI